MLPGLIDLHTHLVGPVETGDAAAVLDRSPAEEALAGVANARATLDAGVTTVRDVGTFWAFVDIDLRRAIDAGVVEGPRMQCAGAYLTCSGGGGEITGVPDGVVVPPQMRDWMPGMASRRNSSTPPRTAPESVSTYTVSDRSETVPFVPALFTFSRTTMIVPAACTGAAETVISWPAGCGALSAIAGR